MLLDILFKSRYVPNFNTQIPIKAWWELQHEGFWRKFREYRNLARRSLWLFITRQKQYERAVIPAGVKRILWLAPSLQNIGDSIMSLSGRVLLKDKYQIDLLVNKKNLPLFAMDNVFSQVHSNPAELNGCYDLILLYCVKNITLKVKTRYFRKIPYCHFRGFFDGIEFNWILYSFHRINALLNYPYTQHEIDMQARTRLNLPDLMSYNSKRLIVAIGGEDIRRRTYLHWAEVIAGILTERDDLTICLLGNDNALAMAKSLIVRFGDKLVNEVGRHDLLSAASLIKNSSYFIGCDGGLMHIASACELSGVALFGYFEPEYRLPYHSKLVAFFHERSVDYIEPRQVANGLLMKLG